ncbi:hypothetical protein EYC84_005257 [Monilinia fructicola]|uniref:Uncharacterized protein n=1 Tax=Monilinia fructicola TaxID=38448 RepID=A0A5M9JYF5_MONFR|nr:hypothetical protein EYC84_005257 [Monilinia fructicola]
MTVNVFSVPVKDAWANAEYYWEGSFAIVASVIITLMGAALLRVSKMKEKWTVKLRQHLEPSEDTRTRRWYSSWLDFKSWGEKHFMFVLPFITVLREGLEAVVFVAGVSFSTPPTSIPLPVVIGLIAGLAVGYIIYKGGSTSKTSMVLGHINVSSISCSCRSLLQSSVVFPGTKLEQCHRGDAAETGAGPGSYEYKTNFGNPELNGGGGWGIFNAILGWQNSATYGSVISYNLYWLVVIVGFLAMRYKEIKGHLPLAPALEPYLTPVKAVQGHVANIKERAIYKDGEKCSERSREDDGCCKRSARKYHLQLNDQTVVWKMKTSHRAWKSNPVALAKLSDANYCIGQVTLEIMMS